MLDILFLNEGIFVPSRKSLTTAPVVDTIKLVPADGIYPCSVPGEVVLLIVLFDIVIVQLVLL